MAAAPSTTQLRNIAKRLAAHGITVKLYPGWETRGRPYAFGPIHGFQWHHTGSDAQSDAYLKFLFVDGRESEGIPGPLCQFAIRSNGEIWIGAAGRANHAGRGSSSTMRKVISGDYAGHSVEITPGADDVDGNQYYVGVEIMYAGTHGMTEAQYHSAVHLAAEYDREFGWTALRNIGHREHSGRKWDPGSHKLYTMRRDTSAALASTEPEPKEWWEMAIPQAEIDRIADAVWGKIFKEYLDPDGDGVRQGRTIGDFILLLHKAVYEKGDLASTVWGKEFKEFIDPDGDGVRDPKAVSYVLFKIQQMLAGLLEGNVPPDPQ